MVTNQLQRVGGTYGIVGAGIEGQAETGRDLEGAEGVAVIRQGST